jgi:hypothetical protein
MRGNMEEIVLCGASSYTQKFYFNESFNILPEAVKKELQIICVLYTEDVGGVLTLVYDKDGRLEFQVTKEECDYLFDEIGSVLKIKQIRQQKQELIKSLEIFYLFIGKCVL